MDTGATGTSRASAVINVTPLIDVLLVLLIIFMVIQPAVGRGLAASVPQPAKHAEMAPDPRTIVLTVSEAGETASYAINGQNIAVSDLGTSLRAILDGRSEKVLFIQGDPHLQFSAVAEAVNVARASGADVIGLLTPRSMATQ